MFFSISAAVVGPVFADAYESTGVLGDVHIQTGETVEINTGVTPPTLYVEAFPIGYMFKGRVDSGIAVFDFNNVYVAQGATVTVLGNRPLSMAAKGDMWIGSSFDVSEGKAGGGAGGAGGTGSAVLPDSIRSWNRRIGC